MPKGTMLDLNVACIAMALCLDSGGERVTHTETARAIAPAPAWNEVWKASWRISPDALDRALIATTESAFSEIARELAASVWGVTL